MHYHPASCINMQHAWHTRRAVQAIKRAIFIFLHSLFTVLVRTSKNAFCVTFHETICITGSLNSLAQTNVTVIFVASRNFVLELTTLLRN